MASVTAVKPVTIKPTKCCLCGDEIEPPSHESGNLAWPVAEKGVCCDLCNIMVVIPARIAEFVNHNSQKEKK